MSHLQKTRATSTTSLRCSFCVNEPADSSDLIVGPSVCICASCVGTCADMLADKEPTDSEPAFDAADDAEPLVEEPRSPRVFFRLLTEADVARLVTPDDLIDAMEDAVRRFSAGEVVQPVRTVLSFGPHEFFGLMPAYVQEPAMLGAKLVTVCPGNTAIDLPSHLATILLFSPKTGALVALMDGRYITAARTAAVSAISADVLARDDAAVMAIIGSGVQARSHLAALECVFQLDEVRVWRPTAEHQASFMDEVGTRTDRKLVGTTRPSRPCAAPISSSSLLHRRGRSCRTNGSRQGRT